MRGEGVVCAQDLNTALRMICEGHQSAAVDFKHMVNRWCTLTCHAMWLGDQVMHTYIS